MPPTDAEAIACAPAPAAPPRIAPRATPAARRRIRVTAHRTGHARRRSSESLRRDAGAPRNVAHMNSRRPVRPPARARAAAAALTLALLAAAGHATAQQVPDSTFDTRIERPAWPQGRGPRLVLDESHHNFHTLDGRYRPFGDLARADGFRVAAGTARFTRASLAACDLLLIANALGAPDMGDPAAEQPAFTDAEVAELVRWIERGGALLLVADHAPMGSAAASLGRALGVDMRRAYTLDPARSAAGNPTTIAYEPGAGLDTSHAIARGRAGDPPVRRVVTYTGQSLDGPAGAAKLLALSDEAFDAMVTFGQWQSLDSIPADARRPAAGRAQGLAFERGRGRVVVMGEAAMLTAQLAGPGGRFKVGMNAPGSDDRQFAINVLRWLGRGL